MSAAKSARHIIESALSAYLSAIPELSGVAVYKGDSDDMNVLPKMVVLCDSARAPNGLPEGLGNYSGSVRITIVTSADDNTLTQHRERCQYVAGAMAEVASVQAVFTSQGDAACYDVTPLSEDEGVSERNWASVLSYDVLVVVNPQ